MEPKSNPDFVNVVEIDNPEYLKQKNQELHILCEKLLGEIKGSFRRCSYSGVSFCYFCKCEESYSTIAVGFVINHAKDCVINTKIPE